ncbi:prolyl-tRNA synthetase associated domain-containing protein [Danxiaibacter flavus]|uniref:Prolyl-tRNA synthetase associated domain-containing protein n=1 Tax=Danxiaibacter flavus TaxID=3049108 RepID=A0ABV3ZHC1_9BACT|nr:prolyl-tRNA synthetase associated domain-containing protein [Chitinophagaceae bacterium DXS]
MEPKQKALDTLDRLGVTYEVTEHDPVYTIEDMDKLEITGLGDVCKNLFLRDDKGRRHFLVVLDKGKSADIKSIQQQIDCTRLSFASDERLDKYLKLKRGEVSPLGIINDVEKKVEVVLDKDIVGRDRLGFHPNVNTATVWISFDDLRKVIEANGNSIKYVTV